MAQVDHLARKIIQISRDLIEIAELGVVIPEYRDLINNIKSGVKVDSLPCNRILRQLVRKTKSTGALKNAYNEMYTVDTGNRELVYLSKKLVPPRAARPGIEESAYQGPSPQTQYTMT